MPFLKCCLKPRSYYIPDEVWKSDMLPEGPFQLNREKLLKRMSSSSSSDKMQKPVGSPKKNRKHTSSASSKSSKKADKSSSKKISTPAAAAPVIPFSRSSSSSSKNKKAPAVHNPTPMKSKSKSISKSRSKSKSRSSSMELAPVSAPAAAAAVVAAEVVHHETPKAKSASSSDAGQHAAIEHNQPLKPAPLAPPSEHRLAKAMSQETALDMPKPKSKAKAKAKGKSPGIRSGNQIVHNAISDSPTGLRTKDHSKMVEMLEPNDKKNYIWAANFLRETIDVDPNKDHIMDREAAVLMFLLLNAAKIQSTGGINPGASVCTHLSSTSAGDPALASKQATADAPKVQFTAQKFYRPVVDAIIAGEVAKHTPEGWLKELDDATKFAIGTKPKFFEQRIRWISAFMSGSYLGVSGCHQFDTYLKAFASKPTLIKSIADAFDTAKKGGDFQSIFAQIN